MRLEYRDGKLLGVSVGTSGRQEQRAPGKKRRWDRKDRLLKIRVKRSSEEHGEDQEASKRSRHLGSAPETGAMGVYVPLRQPDSRRDNQQQGGLGQASGWALGARSGRERDRDQGTGEGEHEVQWRQQKIPCMWKSAP